MQGDSFKPVGQELSVRGRQTPMMPQGAQFAAVPVQPGSGHSVRDITGRAGAQRNNKSAPPQGALEVRLAGGQPPMTAPGAQPVQMAGAQSPRQPSSAEGITIPRRPAEAPQHPTMGRQRPFMQRAVPKTADSYMVTLFGTAPDGQVYEVPYIAQFPVGTQLGAPEIRPVEDQG